MFLKASTTYKKFDPLVGITFLAVISWLATNSQFGAAKRVNIPPEPYMLKELTLQIDAVGTGPRINPTKRRQQANHAIWAFSNDYPNIPFQLTGTAYGLSIKPPMKITFLVSRDPQKLLNIKYNGTASVISPIHVYGAKIDDVLVADPVIGYDKAVKYKTHKLFIAWIAAFFSLICTFISGWLIWRRFSKYLL